ncbi:MAG: cytochrome c peroxidase [Candidatus Latescibacterota bacterium]|nr:cytochrome c peroxidase [Candidatus Latescibacterota bacterium]
MIRPTSLVFLVALVLASCGDDPASSSHSGMQLQLNVPEGFPVPEMPPNSPLTVEGVGLGSRLFHDPILSIDSTVACASCHQVDAAFSDPALVSQGVAGTTQRNSMPLINLAWSSQMFWDGRAVSLEDQARQAVVDPVEMGESWDHVVEKLQRHPEYPALFDAAFGEPLSEDLAVAAIAQFERTLISSDSKFDRYLAGKAEFTEQELFGLELFNSERGDCFHCHGTVLLTDNQFHNNGLDAEPVDIGLATVTGSPFDVGKFKSPTLRNVELTAPYMHDGRFKTLEEIIDHYSDGVQLSPTADPLMRVRAVLTATEKAALVALLRTFTDLDFIETNRPSLK